MAANSHLVDSPSMTESKPEARLRDWPPAGLMFLAVTSVGWGFNWPVTKYLLSELPPLTLRGGTGVIGAVLLAVLALARGQSLKVAPRAVAAAGAGGAAQCHGLDGADGARAGLLAGQRDRADRLHHADMGGDAGLAGARRAADRAARRSRW